MSRCLLFPPPGYEKNGLSGETLIEWIKIEREKALKERKKAKKRVKKEKMREEKEKSRKNRGVEKKKQSHGKSHKNERTEVDHKRVDNPKRREDEKSDLSEEHEQPTNNQKAYNSSDSTQNRSKSAPVQEQHCSTSGRTDILSLDNAEPASRSNFFGNDSLQLVDLRYRNLIKNCVHPLLQIEHTDFDDMEWLFEGMQHHMHKAKRFKGRDGATCHGGSCLWPRTCYLSEINLYELPYTVPY